MTLTDIFTPDAFGVVDLTNAVAKIPANPGYIGSLGIFENKPIKSTTAVIEDSRGVLMLVPTTHRSGPGISIAAEKRNAYHIPVPHYQVEDAIFADDVIGVRAFGSSEQQTANQVMADKLAAMKRSIEATMELMKLRALHGVITYPTNSVDADVNLFTLLGTSEVEVDFVLNTATTKIVEGKCADVRDAMEAALGGTPITGIVALCGRAFFRALISHKEVRDLYLAQQPRILGNQMGVVNFDSFNQQSVELGGIRFVEYYGSVGGTTFINTNHARFFPVGPGIFSTALAPGDFVEAVGTYGVPMYARQWISPDGKRVNLETQANQLHFCTRPRALIKGIRHTGD